MSVQQSFKEAMRTHMGAIILGFPFVLYLFASLGMNNQGLRTQLVDMQRYYERRLAQDEAANNARHDLSLDHRKKLEAGVDEDRKRLGAIEARLKAIETELSR